MYLFVDTDTISRIYRTIKCNKKNFVYWAERLKEHLQLPKNIDNTTLKHSIKNDT